MADKHTAAVELVDSPRQTVDGLEVQVIRGFVQQQQMRFLSRNPRECDLTVVERVRGRGGMKIGDQRE